MTGAEAQPVQRCPLCGGYCDSDREVDEMVREGDDVLLVRVMADVCRDCGEALLHPGMVDRMIAARRALRADRAAGATVVGRVLRSAS